MNHAGIEDNLTVYNASLSPAALAPGDTGISIGKMVFTAGVANGVLTAEASTLYPTGTAGASVALNQNQDGSERDISVELSFSVDPGAFAIDIQTADTNVDDAFQTLPTSGSITAASKGGSGGGIFWARGEFHTKAKFARLRQKTVVTNPCNQTGAIIG